MPRVPPSAQQMLDDQLVERLVVAYGDERLGGVLVEAADLLQEPQECRATVDGVGKALLDRGGAEGVQSRPTHSPRVP